MTRVVIPPELLLALGASSRMGSHTRWAGPLSETATRHEINTPLRLAHWLGQLAHESARFNATVEGASGSDYEGNCVLGNIQSGDGRRFKGGGVGQLTGRNNYTGYTAYVRRVHGPSAPDFVADPGRLYELPWAADSAGWYWRNGYVTDAVGYNIRYRCGGRQRHYNGPTPRNRDINPAADRGMNDAVIREVTFLINGGANGLRDRVAKTRIAHRYISEHWNEMFVEDRANPVVPDSLRQMQREQGATGRVLFRRMSDSLGSNVFTRPKLYTVGIAVPDVPDLWAGLVAALKGSPKPPLDYDLPDDKLGLGVWEDGELWEV